MKIALIHNQYKLRGGTESYLFDLIRGFLAQGDTIDLIVYKCDKDLSLPTDYKVTQLKLPFSLRITKPFLFARALQKQFNPNDYDLTLSVTRTASQHVGICGGTHKGFLAHIPRRKKLSDFLEVYLEKQCFGSSKTIIAHSRLIQQEIEQLYQINSAKIQLLYPPVNTGQFNQDFKLRKNSYREKFGLAPNKFSLLFPSTGHKRKGLYLLLEAFKHLPEQHFELIVAGNKIPEVSATNIKFVGFIKEIAELYAAADITILPSYYEPFGLVVVESIQCGTPVIISPYVGAKDFVTANEGIILNDLNPSAIIEAIQIAKETKFNIAANFIKQNNLELQTHIAAIKRLKFSDV